MHVISVCAEECTASPQPVLLHSSLVDAPCQSRWALPGVGGVVEQGAGHV
jgi:hypothetical protein